MSAAAGSSVVEDRDRIVGQVTLGPVRSRDLFVWCRAHGWTSNRAVYDLRELVREGRLLRWKVENHFWYGVPTGRLPAVLP